MDQADRLACEGHRVPTPGPLPESAKVYDPGDRTRVGAHRQDRRLNRLERRVGIRIEPHRDETRRFDPANESEGDDPAFVRYDGDTSRATGAKSDVDVPRRQRNLDELGNQPGHELRRCPWIDDASR